LGHLRPSRQSRSLPLRPSPWLPFHPSPSRLSRQSLSLPSSSRQLPWLSFS
jgi:hypothetical protein